MCLPAATHAGKGAAPRCETTASGDRGCCFGGMTEVQGGPKGPGLTKKGPSHRDCAQASGKKTNLTSMMVKGRTLSKQAFLKQKDEVCRCVGQR